MKRYLLSAGMAVLVLSLVNADDTGRASLRNAEPAPDGYNYIRAVDTAPVSPELMPAAAFSIPRPFANLTGSSGGCASGACHSCSCGAHDARLGLHPFFSKLLWWKKDSGSCKKCGGLFGPRCNSGLGGPGFNPYPDGVPGTLVFPQHAFIRSPRDFWMADPK